MNIEIEAPEEAEALDLRSNERHRLTVLHGLYLEAGLPLDLAIRSAIADYELFEEEKACA